jgi:hypothetical protein
MELPKRKNSNALFTILMIAIIGFVIVVSSKGSDTGSNNSYVKPYHTRTGKFVKGHVRKSVSTSPNAVKKRNYSKGYYYRNKFRYRKTKKK